MPNWCQTNITFNGENAKQLENLINKWTSKNQLKNDFGENWLGNVVLSSGLATKENIDDYPCRGSITYVELQDDQLLVDTETAWSPCLKMWDEINKKYSLNLEIIYSAEEPGNDLYLTNDPVNRKSYFVDGEIEDQDYFNTFSEEETSEICKKYLNKCRVETEGMSLEDMLDTIEKVDYQDGDNLKIKPWQFMELEEWVSTEDD